jgi:hypothetical protein
MNGLKVVSASKQDRLRPDGGRTTVYVVWLSTTKGASGSIEVSPEIWESDGLKDHLMQEAAKLDRAFDVLAEM